MFQCFREWQQSKYSKFSKTVFFEPKLEIPEKKTLKEKKLLRGVRGDSQHYFRLMFEFSQTT